MHRMRKTIRREHSLSGVVFSFPYSIEACATGPRQRHGAEYRATRQASPDSWWRNACNLIAVLESFAARRRCAVDSDDLPAHAAAVVVSTIKNSL
jgi:hypothetical protein